MYGVSFGTASSCTRRGRLCVGKVSCSWLFDSADSSQLLLLVLA